MNAEEQQIFQKLKDDFPHYALRCLKIRTKSGEIKPFVLNKAQLYVHEKLEEQRKKTGKVRALVLKGRQQGMCLSPDTKVLTADYRWVKIDDLSVGDKIVACDENGVGLTKSGRKTSRKLNTAVVEHKAEFVKDVVELQMDNGARLILTLDHRMLSKQRGGDYPVWRKAEDFIIGDSIRVLTRPPQAESTFEDGWIGGIIDGEGSWRGKKGPKRLSLHQVDGPVLQRIKKYFKNIDIPYCEVIDKRGVEQCNKIGTFPVHRIDIHRMPYLLEILSRTRPTRFINRDWHSGHELPGKKADGGISPWTKIVSIKLLGKRRVIDIQTSEKTFIAEGLVSHNSTYIGARFYHKVTFSFGCQAFILAHSLDATNNLYKMAQRFYEHTPNEVQPIVSKSNAKELIFGRLDSGYKLGTAENKQVGRSATIQLLHGSETAFWNNAKELSTGIMQAVPDMDSTEIILESTANGVGNFFHQQWQDAEAGISEFIPIFVPWFWQDEYRKTTSPGLKLTPLEEQLSDAYGLTLEQLAWRRAKVTELSVNGIDGEKAFQQEYPCIVGSQKVGTNRGIIPIQNICINDITAQGRVINKWNKGVKETILLETQLGYTLECTTDHKIHSNNNFIEAQLLLNQSVTLQVPLFSEAVYIASWGHLPCAELLIPITEDMALFLGFFMGDGSYSDDILSFAFNVVDQDCIHLISQLTYKLFNINLQYRTTSENGAELRASCAKLREIFLNLGIAEKRPYGTKRKVCVPDCIWKSPKYVVKEFLRGIFETDGFAGYQHAGVKLFSKHESFMKDIQFLLLGFGITSRRTHVEKTNGNGFKYMGSELSLRSSEAREFAAQIGFVSERKVGRQLKWINEFKIGRPNRPIELMDKVVFIKQIGNQEVFDLEIENNHQFDANGFLVHNCCASDAFLLTGEDNFMPSEAVLAARKSEPLEKVGALIIGVDPARFGDDRTCIIRRIGRVAYDLESHTKLDTMQVAGLVATMIEKEKPMKVCIDVGGLGAGVVDRLKELGHGDIVVSVNFGSHPIDGSKYKNKKAEMWGLMREWFLDMPASIPDSDELHSDLCGTKYTFDSNSRLQMESKESMKRRGVRSSDAADALALTFSIPNSALHASINKQREQVLRALSDSMQKRQRVLNNARFKK